jgi:exopolyphosphatase/guanosine-5'-triphosphate,3'-diphosphate pyrophosphatase
VGTFALRTASNASVFLAEAEKILGTEVEVLSGQDEARLIYKGLQRSQHLNDEILVIDIGGGSTEFAVGCGDETRFLISEAMGCVTLRDRFFEKDKIDKAAFDAARAFAREWALENLGDVRQQQWRQAWGTSGTMKAVARIMDGVYRCGYRIQRGQLASVLADMLEQDDVRKLQYKGLNDDRRRLILPGIAIISELLDVLEIDVLEVGTASLREGVLWSMPH